MQSSMDLNPFNRLPAELVTSIIYFAGEVVTGGRVCKHWHQILSDAQLTFLFLKSRKSEWGIEKAINKVSLLKDSSEKIQELKKAVMERIQPLFTAKQLEALNQVAAPSSSLFIQLFSYEKDCNLLIAFEALAEMNQKLKDIFLDSSFNKLSISQKATHLRSLLEVMKGELALIEEIDLNNKGLTLIPTELNLLTNARQVKLAFNSIKKIPFNFGSGWPNLKELHLNDNKIEELPEEFGRQWKEVEKIFLYSNSIGTLPTQFGKNWTKVKHVLLSRNDLEQLPLDFGSNWKALLEINVAFNKAKLDLASHVKQWPKIKAANITT